MLQPRATHSPVANGYSPIHFSRAFVVVLVVVSGGGGGGGGGFLVRLPTFVSLLVYERESRRYLKSPSGELVNDSDNISQGSLLPR